MMEVLPPMFWLAMAGNWAAVIVGVAMVKRDIHWISQWCREHQARDDEQFKKLEAHQAAWERETRDSLNMILQKRGIDR